MDHASRHHGLDVSLFAPCPARRSGAGIRYISTPSCCCTIGALSPDLVVVPTHVASLTLHTSRGFCLVCSVVTGKLPENEVVMAHPSVSRSHALLVVDRTLGAFLIDLGASNGSFVDGRVC